MKTGKNLYKSNWTIIHERKVKGDWIIEIQSRKTVTGYVTHVLYVFDRTLRQFALIKHFDSLQESKNYFNNLIKK